MSRLCALFRLATLGVATLAGAYLARPSPAAEMTLEEIIQAVRENELLYANIDVTFRDSFELLTDEQPSKGRSQNGTMELRFTKSSTSSSRFVSQDQWFRYEEDSRFTTTTNEEGTHLHVSGFDGETTRLYTGFANIVKGYKPAGIPLWPHNMLLRMLGRCEHLSSYLGGDAAISRDPYGYTSSETERTTEYVGPAVFQGLRCQVVRSVVRVWGGGEAVNHGDLWLAEDRNFIPVRVVGYEHRISATEPTGESVVLQWKELKPGIWFPMVAESHCIDQSKAMLKGKRLPGWRRQYVMESVSLEPKHDRSFFQQVPIPDGTVVYEIEGDRIVRGYVKGGPGAQAGARAAAGSPWWRIAMLVAIVIVALACVGYLIKKKRRLQQATA